MEEIPQGYDSTRSNKIPLWWGIRVVHNLRGDVKQERIERGGKKELPTYTCICVENQAQRLPALFMT